MKPLKLEFQAFGPYVEKQTVDFEKLSGKGMFLITGDTGSGKTTIFDAMTFALYGGGSGTDEKSKDGRNDITEWRCTQANDDTPTFVSFTFSTHGKKYVFTRKLVKKRTNFATEYGCCEICPDGTEMPLFTNPKATDLNKKSAELTGLTKEQFRQVVLLPQGQFEKFLTADSGSKEGILKKIFGTEMWGRYAETFYNAAAEKKESLEKIKSDVESVLNSEGCKDPEDLKAKIEIIGEEAAENEKKHTGFDRDKKKKELDKLKKLISDYQEVANLNKEYSELLLKEEDISRKKDKLKRSDKAEPLREKIASFDTSLKELKTREENLEIIKNNVPSAEEMVKTAEEKKEQHGKDSPVNRINKTIGEYESRRESYKNIDVLKNTLEEAGTEKNTAEINVKAQEEKVNSIKAEGAAAKEDFDNSNNTASIYREEYFAGIYGELAGELEEGKKCPVCGSLTHPSPAERKEGSISKADLDKAEKDAKDKRDVLDRIDSRRIREEKILSELNKIFSEKMAVFTKADSDYNAAKKNLIDGIESETALNEAILKLQNEAADYEKKQKELEDDLRAKVDKLTALKASLTAAEDEKEKSAEKHKKDVNVLNSALRTAGYGNKEEAVSDLLDDGERSSLIHEAAEYDARVQDLIKRIEDKNSSLKGTSEPDPEAVKNLEEEIENESKGYESVKAALTSEIKRLEDKYNIYSAQFSVYKSSIHQAENDFSFARKLRGDIGVGIQRYVLAVMFGEVIGEANRMLAKVHGGRYALFRTDDSGSKRKSGLELKVHDSWSPDSAGRSVAMLSGGEKFLVSLALSIGLSTIAQKSGVQTEALFIDEGFGTLDEKSIQDAMDVLESVRAGHVMIGIISHVQLLEDNIPTHLSVIKKDKGSEIVIK